jgi:L-lactate dehydrogenase complex protein LldF
MIDTSQKFKQKSFDKAADLKHRKTINHNIAKYDAVVPVGKKQFADLDFVREKAKNIKWKALETLDVQLEKFEINFLKNGGKVIWAENIEQACEAILKICREKNCKTLVKSKSMVTEEIHLNEFLEKHQIESIETDLGEYIQQLDQEPPYHIVTPAMHKSKEDVARVFHEHLNTPLDLSPEEMTLVAREKMREKYVQAEVGVTGANFLIPETGSIAITENEGNARLSASWPKTHIVITGIEKVIPQLQDLSLFWPLLATYGTGQQMTVYNSIISGPRSAREQDGPDEMYVILLDNGRTNILQDPISRESLYCIRCGACLNACPVYKNIGGHSYGTTYSGPIGSVITPNLKDLGEWNHLSHASSLCGSCTEVCAVKINLHELLLNNRRETARLGKGNMMEKIAWTVWQQSMLFRPAMNLGNSKIKNWMVNKLFKGWVAHRSDLNFPEKTFNQQWKEKQMSQAANLN